MGGLGWRKPSDVALGAALAGAVQATPKVRMMAGMLQQAGLVASSTIMEHYRERIEVMRKRFDDILLQASRLYANWPIPGTRVSGHPERGRAAAFIDQAIARADLQWEKLCTNDFSRDPRPLRADPHTEDLDAEA